MSTATQQPATAPKARSLWVAVEGEKQLIHCILEHDGTLVRHPTLRVPLPGSPSAMVYIPTNDKLHVGLNIEGRASILSLSTNQSNSPLTIDGITHTELMDEPVYLETAGRNHQWLVAAYFSINRLQVYDCSKTPPYSLVTDICSTDYRATDIEPHAAVFFRNRIYVPHRRGLVTHVYALDDATGQLVFDHELRASHGAWPRHLSFIHNGNHGYISNENTSSVSVVQLNHNKLEHTLVSPSTISTLPPGYSLRQNTVADIHVTPNNRFVYVSNRGHDSIAMFEVLANYTLRHMGNIQTSAARPREFAISPDGLYLVVAGYNSGSLESFRIEESGWLTPLSQLQISKPPVPERQGLRWVIIQ
ncbi:MAG: lactonase family protein [Myxococcales bacterium]|nr:lactonase family protein [Myxococcales bacterium]